MKHILSISAAIVSLAASTFAQAPAAPAAPSEEQMTKGKAVYMQVCVACHQPTGLGLPPVFPTLSKTEYVTGSIERNIAMVLKGVMGPITVDGKVFNSVMPPQEAMLTDDKIADVLTFVRNSFGNQGTAVSKELVAATREKFKTRTTSWTEAELKAWKDDAATAAPAAPATPEAPATPAK